MSILQPYLVTITGVTDKVDLHELRDLSLEYPFVEWGVLAHARRRDARYPDAAFVHDFGAWARLESLNTAFHACGVEAIALAASTGDVTLTRASRYYGRIQLNFREVDQPSELLGFLQEAFVRRPDHIWITPYNRNCQVFWRALQCLPNYATLADGSGGRGKLPEEWPAADTMECPMGYAGGLGPETIAEQFPQILKAAGTKPFWIDMETGVRDPVTDTLDLDKVRSVLHQINEKRKTYDDQI